jgi:hypothetical protein
LQVAVLVDLLAKEQQAQVAVARVAIEQQLVLLFHLVCR